MNRMGRRRRWVDAAWIVLAVLVIAALSRSEPSFEEKLGSIAVPGVAGDRTVGRNFAVKTGDVKAARAYLIPSSRIGDADAVPLRTSGIWLSVEVETEALVEPGYISAQLRDGDGRIFPATDGSRFRLPDVNADDRLHSAGLPERGVYFFEVPPELSGLRLQVFWGALTPLMMDSLVDIDLGIDAARAQALLAEANLTVDLRP